jgi:hypothetical protein
MRSAIANDLSLLCTMSPLWKYILGPELLWLIAAGLMKWLGLRNVPPTEEGSQFLEQFWWWLAFLVVPLTFVVFAMPGPSRWWLLLRVAVAGLVGMCWASYIVTGYIDYRDSRNSGVPMGWLLSTGLGWSILLVGCVVSAVVIWWKSRAAG